MTTHTPNENGLASDVAHSLATQTLGLLLSFANGAVLAAVLGPKLRGQLSVVLLLRVFLVALLDGGQGPASAILQARLGLPRVAAVLTVHSAAATLLGVALMLIAVVGGATPKLLPEIPTWAICLAIAPLGASLLAGSVKGLLLGLGRLRRVNTLNLLDIALAFAANLLFVVVLKLGMLGGLVASLAVSAVSVLLCTDALRRAGGRLSFRCDLGALRASLSLGAGANLANFAQLLSYRADLFLVASLLGSRDAGLYAVSTSISETLWYLPNATAATVFARTASRSARPLAISKGLVVNATGGVLLAVALAWSGPFLLEHVYSPPFAAAYPVLLALLPGSVLTALAKVMAAEIAGRGHLFVNAAVSLGGSVLMILLDLLLIPRWGLVGAGTAASIAYSVSALATTVVHARLIRRE